MTVVAQLLSASTFPALPLEAAAIASIGSCLDLEHPSVLKDLEENPERGLHVINIQGRLHASILRANAAEQREVVDNLFKSIISLSKAKKGT
jgi:hypothetical protein